MDEYKILTPMQLWADYNPVKQPLDVSVLKIEAEGEYLTKHLYFTVLENELGKVRAYVKLVYPKNAEARPAVIFIPSADDCVSDNFVLDILSKGFVFATFDYLGAASSRQYFTSYPAGMEYANFNKSCECPEQYKGNEASPWFVWVKIARRVVTLLCDDDRVDDKKIGIIGLKEGASIAWKTAGIDGRISMLIPLMCCGYYSSRRYSDSLPKDVNARSLAFLAGVASQSYAKSVVCPTYIATTTNNQYADVDRAGEFLRFVTSQSKALTITPYACDAIDADSYKSLLIWADAILNDKALEIDNPQLEFYVSDGKLYATASTNGQVEKIEVFVCGDEVVPELRNWEKTKKPLMLNQSEYLIDFSIPEKTKKLFIFGRAKYQNGLSLSTEVYCVNPDKLGVTEYEQVSGQKSRLIYSSSSTTNAFFAENDLFTNDFNRVEVKNGPFDIKGVASKNGSLISYRIGDPVYLGEDGYILQLDAYAPHDADIEFIISIYENDALKAFKTVRRLTGSGRWQRINFSAAEFKSEERISLKSWRIAKKLVISNAQDVLFNNILWV